MSDMIATLNRLLQLHSRSLIVYLTECAPWTSPEMVARAAEVREIGEMQRELADRIATRILDLNGAPDLGDFPLNFTGLNDLSFDYLLGELIKRQRSIVQAIATCVSDLQDAPEEALSIAEEAHGAALGNLDRLIELSESAATPS